MANQGWREFEHTADWGLEVWGQDLPALLHQAAAGMYALMGITIGTGSREQRHVVLEGSDRETLLVEFLNELLFLVESEALAFDRFELALDGCRLAASLDGGRIAALDKGIKAVTFHGLAVRDTDRGLEARVVFDV